jgi:hypothetical protein
MCVKYKNNRREKILFVPQEKQVHRTQAVLPVSPDGIHDLNSTGMRIQLVKLEQQPLIGNPYSLALSLLQS